MPIRKAAALVAGLALSLPAFAQQAAPAAAPAAPAASPAAAAAAPKPNCTKPDDFPGRLASEQRKRSWGKDVNAYVECVKKFIDEQKSIGDVHYAAANNAISNLNKEIGEFNAAQKE
jgi:hypothetical protein